MIFLGIYGKQLGVIGRRENSPYNNCVMNVHSFMFDIRPKPTDIVHIAYQSSLPNGKIGVTFQNGTEDFISSDNPKYMEISLK
ncbi:hypothetical protein GCM10010978_30180 [Compostibacillus humi]|uniref:Uncharacterized protein n=1 Tax=Compostibacillus humi TaxID=1245525 RepID=A0A8J2TT73_9BACI|nr:hypothetical protein GCM10010978_30180 [Compostibacillus humi]